LIFIKKYDIIYIESKGKEMINMKVVVRERKSWTESIKEVDVLKEQVIALTEAVENLDEDNARLIMEKAELRQELDEATSGMNAMVKFWNEAVTERDNARAEAANLNLELMEREFRIDELVNRIKWLESQLPHKSTEIVS
jgi:predicted RNase H-like nuclease (RuvC/YqgF family)